MRYTGLRTCSIILEPGHDQYRARAYDEDGGGIDGRCGHHPRREFVHTVFYLYNFANIRPQAFLKETRFKQDPYTEPVGC